jgi:glucose-1-phosphate cytidylyltransferase
MGFHHAVDRHTWNWACGTGGRKRIGRERRAGGKGVTAGTRFVPLGFRSPPRAANGLVMKNIPVAILCGGMGMRLKEETEFRPKPMVEIGSHPILWHIMKSYAAHGFERFILCLGFRGDVIKDYFVNYHLRNSDVETVLGPEPQVRLMPNDLSENWRVTLANTGLNTMTGGRLKKIQKYIDAENFMLTYGDAVSDVDLTALYDFHVSHGKTGTVTGVLPPSRFGKLETAGPQVTSFAEKPVVGGLINGGFFVFNRKVFDYVESTDTCVFEERPLEQMAADGELMVRPHEGFWQCMDTMRDVVHLRSLYENGEWPWLKKLTAAP